MTSTDDPAHHGRAAGRRRGCVINLPPGGRGLLVAEALPARWGWHPVAWPGLTKVVWAEWPISETPDVSRADAASRKGR